MSWINSGTPGLVTLVVALFVASCATTTLPRTAAPTPVVAPAPLAVEVHGHRGARGRFPENSLPAFLFALEKGVEVLELDVLVSRDDEVVVVHDPVLDPTRCLQSDGAPVAEPFVVREHEAAELAALDCGSQPHPRFPEQRAVPGLGIPCLDEVLATLSRSGDPRASTVRLNVELKHVPGRPEWTPPVRDYVRLVLEVLRQRGFLARTQIQSFDHVLLLEVRRQAPEVPLSLLVAKNRVDLVALVEAFGEPRVRVSPHMDWITAQDVRALHAAGAAIVPYTANEAADWERLLDMGVDGIITDYPVRLRGYLERRANAPR